MNVISKSRIVQGLDFCEAISVMKKALKAHANGLCAMPLPQHLRINPFQAEIHIKSSYQTGGPFFAVKVASTYPLNPAQNLPGGNGLILLFSSESGEPVALLEDQGYLTDLRTAAVSAMLTQCCLRRDNSIGIIGTGIQARFQLRLHAEVLDLKTVFVWGRNGKRLSSYVSDMQKEFSRLKIVPLESPADIARCCKLIITTTAAKQPIIFREDLLPGSLIHAIGADSRGKQELDIEIIKRASLVLADSFFQCREIGELQYLPVKPPKAIEMGKFCQAPFGLDPKGVTVADFTGLGIEDLFMAQYGLEKCSPEGVYA